MFILVHDISEAYILAYTRIYQYKTPRRAQRAFRVTWIPRALTRNSWSWLQVAFRRQARAFQVLKPLGLARAVAPASDCAPVDRLQLDSWPVEVQ